MALTINTNISSMIAQKSFNTATSTLNSAIEKMTTGYKINHASDNAAGYSIATNWVNEISSLDVAADNAATGADMLSTLEDTYALINTHLQRVRDLTEQAANGTYGTASKVAIKSEITARLQEINRISKNCEYGGLKLMNGSLDNGVNLQVGLNSDTSSLIALSGDLFKKVTITALFGAGGVAGLGEDLDPESTRAQENDDSWGIYDLSSRCADLASTQLYGHDDTTGKYESAHQMLEKLDNVINEISHRVTTLGAAENRVESSVESISVQTENLTSSLSTIKDADIAEVSSAYLKSQILQQSAATLLATANQAPSIALNLI